MSKKERKDLAESVLSGPSPFPSLSEIDVALLVDLVHYGDWTDLTPAEILSLGTLGAELHAICIGLADAMADREGGSDE